MEKVDEKLEQLLYEIRDVGAKVENCEVEIKKINVNLKNIVVSLQPHPDQEYFDNITGIKSPV